MQLWKNFESSVTMAIRRQEEGQLTLADVSLAKQRLKAHVKGGDNRKRSQSRNISIKGGIIQQTKAFMVVRTRIKYGPTTTFVRGHNNN